MGIYETSRAHPQTLEESPHLPLELPSYEGILTISEIRGGDVSRSTTIPIILEVLHSLLGRYLTKKVPAQWEEIFVV